MGRPRKQTVDYFPHFVSTDSKTKFILEQTWGNDGYAFWFKLLELLGRSDGHCYDCSDVASTKYLSALTRTSDSTTEEILNTLADLGNIDRELWKEHRLIWCQSFVDNLQDVYSKRTAVIPQKPVFDHKKELQQEKKVDEKPKKKKSILTAEQQELFEKFYAVYPKKVDRATAERAWAKIEPTPDEEITWRVIKAVEAAKKYDNRFREKQYIPNPASWLNAKGYLNEYEEGGANRERTDEHAGHRREFRGSDGFMGQGQRDRDT